MKGTTKPGEFVSTTKPGEFVKLYGDHVDGRTTEYTNYARVTLPRLPTNERVLTRIMQDGEHYAILFEKLPEPREVDGYLYCVELVPRKREIVLTRRWVLPFASGMPVVVAAGSADAVLAAFELFAPKGQHHE